MLTVKTPKLHALKLKLSLISISTFFLVCSLFLNSTLHSSCFIQTNFTHTTLTFLLELSFVHCALAILCNLFAVTSHSSTVQTSKTLFDRETCLLSRQYSSQCDPTFLRWLIKLRSTRFEPLPLCRNSL